MKRPVLLFSLTLTAALGAQDRTIRLPRDPRLSPDGAQVAFAWRGDVWIASSDGGAARRLTTHPSDDSAPWFTPDQQAVVFTSSRDGSSQLYRVPVQGGAPVPLTSGSDRKTVHGFADDLLTTAVMADTPLANTQACSAPSSAASVPCSRRKLGLPERV